MCDVCVLCADRAEVVFETSAGQLHSACGHGACRRCLSAHVEAALPGCLRQWALEVQCPAAGCGRRLPQRLVLSVSAAEKLAAVLDQAVVWPEEAQCPRCGAENSTIHVNRACGHSACAECWLADLEPKLQWSRANCTLDIPCCHLGCSQGCSEVLQRLSPAPLAPLDAVQSYVQEVQQHMKDFSAWCVHGGAPCTPGPECSKCGSMSLALLHCSCGVAACRQCWQRFVDEHLPWCRDNFAFFPDCLTFCCSPLHRAQVVDLLPTMTQDVKTHETELKATLLRLSCAAPRGRVGPSCPICGEVRVALLCHKGHETHAACEQCWGRWAEEQLEQCVRCRQPPARCLWPDCCVDMIEAALWTEVQKSSQPLQQHLTRLARRKRLQRSPMYPAALQVDCPSPSCVGLGYLGFDTVMCFICERQWDAESGVTDKPPELLPAGSELQVAGLTVRRCPQCQEYIEKNGGCDHMTCRCRHQFSWTTLKPWR
ncbi:unnamed protein product [Effrenium voratum]|nr:unnamed protein product [Effrenium voratum]